MMAEFDGIEAGWGVYEVGRTPHETEEVHVVPRCGVTSYIHKQV